MALLGARRRVLGGLTRPQAAARRTGRRTGSGREAGVSAETLRKAAALMRERAEAAYHPDAKYEPGRWMTEHHDSKYHSQPNACHIAEDRSGVYWTVASEVYIPIAEHMAGLDPLTAFQIANWLDRSASRWWWLHDKAALDVATAYLGTAS